MSLLPALNAARSDNNNPEYYFALSGGTVGPVSDTAFVATGIAGGAGGSFLAQAQGASAGSFTANGNGTAPLPTTSFNLSQSAGTPVFSMGLLNVPTGVGNAGNDFAISRYDDNGGYQGAQLTITRSNGTVAVANGLTVGSDANISGNLEVVGDLSGATLNVSGNANIGLPSTAGGGLLEIEGTLGLGRVYDTVYNRPSAGAEVLNNSYGPTGTLLTSITYTPTISGLFSVTMEVSVDTAALAWTNGTSLIVGYMGSPFPPFPINSDSYLVCDSVADPAGFLFPVSPPPYITGIYKKDMVALVNLTAGIQYAAQAVFSAGINLGTTGGVRFFIQPILA